MYERKRAPTACTVSGIIVAYDFYVLVRGSTHVFNFCVRVQAVVPGTQFVRQ